MGRLTQVVATIWLILSVINLLFSFYLGNFKERSISFQLVMALIILVSHEFSSNGGKRK